MDDIRYWYRGDPPERSPAIASANLLQILDEYYRGYQHTRGLLDVAQRVPRGRESSTGMVLIDAQIVAGMTRNVGTDRVVFEIRGLRACSERTRR